MLPDVSLVDRYLVRCYQIFVLVSPLPRIVERRLKAASLIGGLQEAGYFKGHYDSSPRGEHLNSLARLL